MNSNFSDVSEMRKLTLGDNASACIVLGNFLLETATSKSHIQERITYLKTQRGGHQQEINNAWDLLGQAFTCDLFMSAFRDCETYHHNAILELDMQIYELERVESERQAIFREAFECYLKAAELNDSEGMWCLGWRYWLGEGTEINRQIAVNWWEQASIRGHSLATQRLHEIGYSKSEDHGHILIVNSVQNIYNTNGGAIVNGPVTTSGDFVGRDQINLKT